MRRRFLGRKIDNNYLTFEILGDNARITFSGGCEYCIDGDEYWRQLTADGSSILVNKGQTVSFRANLIPNIPQGIGEFTCTQRFNIHGNCMSMLHGDTAAGKYSLTEYPYAFKSLFNLCMVENVDEDILPATTLSRGCYANMFEGCNMLKSTPKLPATTLADRCYYSMFHGCSSLTTAPELPATALEGYCYANMFDGCSSLTTAPELPATTLADSCYYSMFYGCSSLTTAPELPATALEGYCYANMFNGCSSLTTAPELPATTLADSCYYRMFRGCSSLTTAPELPATTLADRCYYSMFHGCRSLNYIKAMFTTTPSSSYTGYWVSNVASTGTFIKNKNATWNVIGVNGIPSGWTVQTV